jgi:hypothetical protein
MAQTELETLNCGPEPEVKARTGSWPGRRAPVTSAFLLHRTERGAKTLQTCTQNFELWSGAGIELRHKEACKDYDVTSECLLQLIDNDPKHCNN